MKITPDKFTYLQVVAEEKNITRAAEKLYVSQPALTSYINKVENYYGVKLFNRSQNPITLTYAGEQFMKGMNEIIQLQQKFDNDMEELANHRAGRITIGIGSTRGMIWLPYLLPTYKAKYPDIDIQVVEGNKSILEQKLLKGTIDFFISSLPVNSEGITYEVIREEKIYLLIPADHPLVKDVDLSGNSVDHPFVVSAKALNGQHFLVSEEGQSLHHFAQKVLQECNIQPGEITRFNNSLTACLLACYGSGLTFIPDTMFMTVAVQRKPVIAVIDQIPMSRQIAAAYNSSIGLSVFSRKYVDITKEIISSEPKAPVHTYYEESL